MYKMVFPRKRYGMKKGKPARKMYKPKAKAGYKKRAYRKRAGAMLGYAKKSAAGNMTESRFVQRMRASRVVKGIETVGQPQVFVFNKGYNALTQEGRQGAIAVADLGATDLRQILSTVQPTGANPAGTSYVKRAIIESVIGECEFTNSSTARVNVDVYDIIRIRDSNPNNVSSTAPLLAWYYGSGAQTPAGNDLSFNVIIGTQPTDSQAFKDYFKILKRTHLVMDQGATHRHMFSRRINKIVDNEVVGDASYTGNSNDLKPYTHYVMVVFHGQACATDSTTEPSYATTTTAQVRLDLVQTYRVKYTQVSWNSPNLYYDSGALLSGVTDDLIVNAGSGQIETSHTAGGK